MGGAGRRRQCPGRTRCGGWFSRSVTCRPVLAAIIWGLVQGLTEFLPISSSGHLVLVPAFLTALGMEVPEPSLLVSAVLHLGTLLAVVVYFRKDLLRLLRFRTDAEARRMLLLLV